MKNTSFLLFATMFVALLSMTACRNNGSTEQTTTETAIDSTTQVVEGAVAAPVDSLSAELDQTADEIEQGAKDLESALDSL